MMYVIGLLQVSSIADFRQGISEYENCKADRYEYEAKVILRMEFST